MKKTFTIGYRIGGTKNFQWKRTIAFLSEEEARKKRDEIINGGRLAYIYDTDKLNAIGLPTTYDPFCKPADCDASFMCENCPDPSI